MIWEDLQWLITVSKHDMEHSEKIAEIYPYHCIVRKKIHETTAVENYGKTRSRALKKKFVKSIL